MPQNSEPNISVVIPTYKGVDCVMRAVHSVAAQTYKDFETIVVIDGSNDGTQELLECYKAALPEDNQDRFRILTQNNAGVSAARNNGMNHARGKFIALLDDDDKWHPEKLAAQMNEIAKYPGESAVFCTTDHRMLDTKTGKEQTFDNTNSLTITGLFENSGAQPGTWLFSKQILKKTGGFDEAMSVGEDADFLIRMMQTDGIKRINVSGAYTTYHVGNEKSLSSGVLTPKKAQSHLRGFEKHHDMFKASLPADLFEKYILWHEQNIPADQLAAAMRRIEDRQTKGKSTLAGTTPAGTAPAGTKPS